MHRQAVHQHLNCASDTVVINGTWVRGDLAFRNSEAGDYVPLPGSIAINADDNAYATEATDLLGRPRRFCRRVDIGCYEYSCAPTILFVKQRPDTSRRARRPKR